MYAIKMDTGKELITTVRQSVYQGEKNADALIFLVPNMYDNIDIASCVVLLQYMLPGSDVYADLELTATEHNAEYLAYSTSLDFPITAFSGTVWMRLQIKDAHGHVVLVSGGAALPILCRSTEKPDEPAPDKDKLARLAEQVELLSKEKADSLAYDTTNRKLQLTANGAEVGRPVTVPADDYAGGGAGGAVWESMSGGELGAG